LHLHGEDEDVAIYNAQPGYQIIDHKLSVTEDINASYKVYVVTGDSEFSYHRGNHQKDDLKASLEATVLMHGGKVGGEYKNHHEKEAHRAESYSHYSLVIYGKVHNSHAFGKHGSLKIESSVLVGKKEF